MDRRGGSCAAGANTGSTNAICADGSELTGHVTPTCGTTSAFLSAGDATINPNPCAAGVAETAGPARVHHPAAGAEHRSDGDRAAHGNRRGCLFARWDVPEHRRRREDRCHGSGAGSGQGRERLLPLQAQLLRIPEPRSLSAAQRPSPTSRLGRRSLSPRATSPRRSPAQPPAVTCWWRRSPALPAAPSARR